MIVAKIVENGQISCNYYFFKKWPLLEPKMFTVQQTQKKRVETSQFKRESIIRSNNNKITGQKNGPKLQAKIIIFLREFLALLLLLLLSDIYIHSKIHIHDMHFLSIFSGNGNQTLRKRKSNFHQPSLVDGHTIRPKVDHVHDELKSLEFIVINYLSLP